MSYVYVEDVARPHTAMAADAGAPLSALSALSARSQLQPMRRLRRYARVWSPDRSDGIAETGGAEALRRDALIDQETHHRHGARRRQFPVRRELRGVDRNWPVCPSTRSGIHSDVARMRSARSASDGQAGQFDASGRTAGAAGIEQQPGRQHEAIADHAHRRVCAEHFTKAAKKSDRYWRRRFTRVRVPR